MNHLATQGVLAIYSGGTIEESDIRWYIHNPPKGESPILRALELTPEDVEGLDQEQADWLEQDLAQALLKRIIQHIAIIKTVTESKGNHLIESVSAAVWHYKEEQLKEMMEAELDSITPSITRQEMLTYYVHNPQEFYKPGDRLARHIMLNSQSSEAEISPATLMHRLEAGEDFLSLVRYSESETANSDGYIGWLEKGAVSKPFETALWALEVQEVTGPIQVGDTWHFIQLIDKHEQGLVPFEECQAQIQVRLIEEKSLQHRFKLLGIDASDNPSRDETYSEALLKAAYEKGFDKDPNLAQKLKAFEQYNTADALFTQQVEKRKKRYRNEDESAWYHESETAKDLLNQMGFQLVVILAPANTADSRPPINSLEQND